MFLILFFLIFSCSSFFSYPVFSMLSNEENSSITDFSHFEGKKFIKFFKQERVSNFLNSRSQSQFSDVLIYFKKLPQKELESVKLIIASFDFLDRFHVFLKNTPSLLMKRDQSFFQEKIIDLWIFSMNLVIHLQSPMSALDALKILRHHSFLLEQLQFHSKVNKADFLGLELNFLQKIQENLFQDPRLGHLFLKPTEWFNWLYSSLRLRRFPLSTKNQKEKLLTILENQKKHFSLLDQIRSLFFFSKLGLMGGEHVTVHEWMIDHTVITDSIEKRILESSRSSLRVDDLSLYFYSASLYGKPFKETMFSLLKEVAEKCLGDPASSLRTAHRIFLAMRFCQIQLKDLQAVKIFDQLTDQFLKKYRSLWQETPVQVSSFQKNVFEFLNEGTFQVLFKAQKVTLDPLQMEVWSDWLASSIDMRFSLQRDDRTQDFFLQIDGPTHFFRDRTDVMMPATRFQSFLLGQATVPFCRLSHFQWNQKRNEHERTNFLFSQLKQFFPSQDIKKSIPVSDARKTIRGAEKEEPSQMKEKKSEWEEKLHLREEQLKIIQRLEKGELPLLSKINSFLKKKKEKQLEPFSEFFYDLGKLYAEGKGFVKEDPENAKKFFLKTVEINPDHGGAMYELAVLVSKELKTGEELKELFQITPKKRVSKTKKVIQNSQGAEQQGKYREMFSHLKMACLKGEPMAFLMMSEFLKQEVMASVELVLEKKDIQEIKNNFLNQMRDLFQEKKDSIQTRNLLDRFSNAQKRYFFALLSELEDHGEKRDCYRLLAAQFGNKEILKIFFKKDLWMVHQYPKQIHQGVIYLLNEEGENFSSDFLSGYFDVFLSPLFFENKRTVETDEVLNLFGRGLMQFLENLQKTAYTRDDFFEEFYSLNYNIGQLFYFFEKYSYDFSKQHEWIKKYTHFFCTQIMKDKESLRDTKSIDFIRRFFYVQVEIAFKALSAGDCPNFEEAIHDAEHFIQTVHEEGVVLSWFEFYVLASLKAEALKKFQGSFSAEFEASVKENFFKSKNYKRHFYFLPALHYASLLRTDSPEYQDWLKEKKEYKERSGSILQDMDILSSQMNNLLGDRVNFLLFLLSRSISSEEIIFFSQHIVNMLRQIKEEDQITALSTYWRPFLDVLETFENNETYWEALGSALLILSKHYLPWTAKEGFFLNKTDLLSLLQKAAGFKNAQAKDLLDFLKNR